MLKIWLLLVLAAEAPAIAGQVLCARYVTTGDLTCARQLLLRLLRATAVLGLLSAGALLALAPSVAAFMIPTDPVLAGSARRLFAWAALATPLVAPNALLEGVRRRSRTAVARESREEHRALLPARPAARDTRYATPHPTRNRRRATLCTALPW